MMKESKERGPAFHIGRPHMHNNDPTDFKVKNIKEIVDFDYINKMNLQNRSNTSTEELKKLVQFMKKRNSKQKLKDLKEEFKNMLAKINGSSTKGNSGSHMYQISEKIKELEKNTNSNDIHARF
mmetsp:Transcript_18469/g.17580  ORF Transcript_18469/g.17580 Transcript_18469/m.17580 type:complete len:124 (+) Transcript_18469:484-855(+)